MSCWAHISAIIRIDAFRFTEYQTKIIRKEIREMLGKECDYEADDDVWDDAAKHPEKYLPMGSEGSLQMKIYTNPDISELTAYTVVIWGDLRDAGYTEQDLKMEYIEWFKKKLFEINKKYSIRQATITATNGFITANYTYEEK